VGNRNYTSGMGGRTNLPYTKNGDPLECQNYRRITLLNIMYKVFSNILCTRLKPYVEEVTGSYQCGFREEKSTTDQIQALCQVLERTREFKIDTFHLFIDFKTACDSIKRDKLLSAMQEFGIPVKLINLTRATFKRVKCRIQLQGHLSEPFLTQ
jgi:sorting nexin-29